MWNTNLSINHTHEGYLDHTVLCSGKVGKVNFSQTKFLLQLCTWKKYFDSWMFTNVVAISLKHKKHLKTQHFLTGRNYILPSWAVISHSQIPLPFIHFPNPWNNQHLKNTHVWWIFIATLVMAVYTISRDGVGHRSGLIIKSNFNCIHLYYNDVNKLLWEGCVGGVLIGSSARHSLSVSAADVNTGLWLGFSAASRILVDKKAGAKLCWAARGLQRCLHQWR